VLLVALAGMFFAGVTAVGVVVFLLGQDDPTGADLAAAANCGTMSHQVYDTLHEACNGDATCEGALPHYWAPEAGCVYFSGAQQQQLLNARACSSRCNAVADDIHIASLDCPGANTRVAAFCTARHAPVVITAIVGALTLFYVTVLAKQVLDAPEGFVAMKYISNKVRDGARTFLHTEYKFIAIFVACMFVFILLVVDVATAISYLAGAFVSGACGYGGMWIAVRANVRTTYACTDKGGGGAPINSGLRVAFRSGAVMGLACVGSGLFCLSVLLMIFNDAHPLHGFAMGASSIALFARVGGGIFTKAADVGADLVGKVEAGIPEDSPQNPGTIADNVGDNVGDVAGMGSDLFESYCGSIIGGLTLAFSDSMAGCAKPDIDTKGYIFECVGGVANADGTACADPDVGTWQASGTCKFYTKEAVALPLSLAACGIICSIIGIQMVRTKQKVPDMGGLLWALRNGIFVAGGLFSGGSLVIIVVLFDMSFFIWVAMECGLLAGIMIGLITEYYTSFEYSPTQDVSKAGFTGPATVAIQGFGLGLQSTAAPVFCACISIYCSLRLAGPFGVALSDVGMLSTLGITLATDAYGPVADNAGGLAEMLAESDSAEVRALCPEEVRERTDALDALGNTTAAVGKGFAAGCSMLTALALLQSFMKEGGIESLAIIADEGVIPALLIGGMLPFLFASMTMLAVSVSAGAIIDEVRRQFAEKNDQGVSLVLSGEKEADHEPCIRIATRAAIVEMLMPGALAVMVPVVIGLLLGPQPVVGMLAGSTVSATMLALTMGNAGGAWDNAKKYVERGDFGAHMSKNSPVHSANVSGDTIGDPFKDTSGPSMDILIKLMAIVSLVLAKPICSAEREWWHGAIAAGGCVLLIILIQYIRSSFGIEAPDFQKSQYPLDRPNESRAALVQTLHADIDNAQKKTKECMEKLEDFCEEPGVYNYETGQLDMVKFRAMRDKINTPELKAKDEAEGQKIAP
jgi:K(+)-stimulated pyrophosphate-energized sodium pump